MGTPCASVWTPRGFPWTPRRFPRTPSRFSQTLKGSHGPPGGTHRPPGCYHQPLSVPTDPQRFPKTPSGFPWKPRGFTQTCRGFLRTPRRFPQKTSRFPLMFLRCLVGSQSSKTSWYLCLYLCFFHPLYNCQIHGKPIYLQSCIVHGNSAKSFKPRNLPTYIDAVLCKQSAGWVLRVQRKGRCH